MDWLKVLMRCASAVGGLAGLAVGLLYVFQEKIIYVPRLPGMPNEYPYTPDQWGMGYNNVWLTTPDGLRLHAWLMWPAHWGEVERRAAPTVMFFQENAGNMAYRLHFLQALTRFLDCNAFILSYRGYGRSEGTPSERGLQLDAECAVDHVLQRADVDPSRVVLFGRSLGGAVAAHAAVARRSGVAGLVLENTFSRLVDLVPHTLPLLRPLVGPGRLFNWLVRNRWDTGARLAGLTDLPILFLSALQDEMLPPHQMEELYRLHPAAPWSITYFPTGRHLDAYDTDRAQYWPALRRFVYGLQPIQQQPMAAATDAAPEQQEHDAGAQQ